MEARSSCLVGFSISSRDEVSHRSVKSLRFSDNNTLLIPTHVVACVMAATYTEYSAAAEIAAFFEKTSASRAACDDRAAELVGGDVVPVDIQGSCSYSVYAGPGLEYIVQFRLEALALKNDASALAREIYGSLVPTVSFEGKIGDERKEPLYIYLMDRVRGVTHLDFILARGFPENSPDNSKWRQNLLSDIARYVCPD